MLTYVRTIRQDHLQLLLRDLQCILAGVSLGLVLGVGHDSLRWALAGLVPLFARLAWTDWRNRRFPQLRDTARDFRARDAVRDSRTPEK